jgi:transcriptional regulator of acetoin/glycerol metabolism
MDDKVTRTDIDIESRPSQHVATRGFVGIFGEEGLPGRSEVTAPVRVGRGSAADHRIPDSKTSRVHVEFRPLPGGGVAGGVEVVDCGSRNGTFVDGRRIEGPTAAPPGTLVRVGRSLMLVVEDVDRYSGYPPLLVPPLIGGPMLDEVRKTIRTVAPTDTTVLVEGPTGSGKECAALAIHLASARRGPFIPVNCAAIPSELIESELFGHARGAFSGSDQPRTGLFREANEGTLLLDEIGELPLPAQAKLLRVLEERFVRPVGEDRPVPVDVRVVVATNRSLDEMVAAGRFRADVLHRVSAARMVMPSLAVRPDDVPLLCAHFTTDRALGEQEVGFTATAMERLVLAPWPGNVRQLRNVVRMAAARAHADDRHAIELLDVNSSLGSAPARESLRSAEEEVERVRLITALEMHQGNVSKVGRDLGIHRTRLYEAFERLSIDPHAYRQR